MPEVTFALITDNGVIFPYSYYNLQQDNRQVSFPAEPDQQLLDDWGLVWVHEVRPPEHDTETTVAVDTGCAYNESSQRWETAWTLRAKTQAEIDNNLISS